MLRKQGLLTTIWSARVDESWRLLTVDGLLKVAVKKGVLHVQLVNRPGTGCGNAEYRSYGGRFDNRAKRLVVIDVVLLRKTTNVPPGFMTGEGAISMILVLEDPLAGDNISPRWSRYEAPGAIIHERLVLFMHRSPPIGVGQGGTRVGGQR